METPVTPAMQKTFREVTSKQATLFLVALVAYISGTTCAILGFKTIGVTLIFLGMVPHSIEIWFNVRANRTLMKYSQKKTAKRKKT